MVLGQDGSIRGDEHGAEGLIAGAKGIGRQFHTASQVTQIVIAHHESCPTLLMLVVDERGVGDGRSP